MPLFLEILTTITGPIVVLIGLGWLAGHRLKLDAGGLNRLLLYVIIPAFLAHYLATSSVPIGAAWDTAWFTAVQFLALAAVGWAIARACGLRDGMPAVIGLAMALSNSGNFGLPLAELAFGPDMVLHQAVIVSTQSIFVFTLGFVMILGAAGWRQGLRGLINPIFPAVIIGLALNAFEVELPTLIGLPLEMLGRLYTPLALFTLGAQLTTIRTEGLGRPLALTAGLKLLLAPLLTWLALLPLAIEREIADLLTVTASAPVGVTLAILAAQAGRATGLSAAAVFVTTVISPLSVSLWLLFLRA